MHTENMRVCYVQTMENLDTMRCFTGSPLGKSHAHLSQSYEMKLSRVQNKSWNSYVALLIGWQKNHLLIDAGCFMLYTALSGMLYSLTEHFELWK